MSSKKHTHKYMFVQLKFAKVWRCALPECNHYMPPHMDELMSGRYSICWGCSNKFVLDEVALQSEQPMCYSCRTPHVAVETVFGDISIYDQYLRDKEKELTKK